MVLQKYEIDVQLEGIYYTWSLFYKLLILITKMFKSP